MDGGTSAAVVVVVGRPAFGVRDDAVCDQVVAVV
jgi:hypothetical protein